ncbi:MAG: hypothetical protein HFH67_09720 [Lachnospiraceae bacterium]|nr:hypothetical protein [Lachnospiraceae bacterium]
MKQKIKHIICTSVNSIIIAGIIICFTGLYYSVFKAGIPYQDAPLDLKIQYEINAGIGAVLAGTGFKIIIFSSITRLALRLVWKR